MLFSKVSYEFGKGVSAMLFQMLAAAFGGCLCGCFSMAFFEWLSLRFYGGDLTDMMIDEKRVYERIKHGGHVRMLAQITLPRLSESSCVSEHVRCVFNSFYERAETAYLSAFRRMISTAADPREFIIARVVSTAFPEDLPKKYARLAGGHIVIRRELFLSEVSHAVYDIFDADIGAFLR